MVEKNIDFDKVADIYDYYVSTDFDIPFFMKETIEIKGEILELMCGTGRVSIPLIESGRKMICIDYSLNMLKSFAKKIINKSCYANLITMDITNLCLKRTFDMIIIPFHSLSEIISPELQKKALSTIPMHLKPDGKFILTLQNPKVRLKAADGKLKNLGVFAIDNKKKMAVQYVNQYNSIQNIVTGFQLYEIFDQNDNILEKRSLEIKFRPISNKELMSMIKDLNLELIEIYGDYSYGLFNEETSPFIIYKFVKKK